MQNGGCVDGGDEKNVDGLAGTVSIIRLRRKCRIGGCVGGGDEKK